LALNLHGIVRATTDADFFIKPERDNIERLKRKADCLALNEKFHFEES
jgi:hypothetical protein